MNALRARSKAYVVWDRDLPGFGVRVLASGRKVFVVQAHGPGGSRRVTIGPHGGLSAAEARKRALVLVRRIRHGEDPGAEPAASGATVAAYDVRVSTHASPRAWASAASVTQPPSGSPVTATVSDTSLPSGFSQAKTYVAQVRSRTSSTGTCGSGGVLCSRWVTSGALAQLDVKGLSAAKMERGDDPSYVRSPALDMDMAWDKSPVPGATYEVAFYYRDGDPDDYYGLADTNAEANSRPDSWRMDWDWWDLCVKHSGSVPTDPLMSRGCGDHTDLNRDSYWAPQWWFGKGKWGDWVPLTAEQAKCNNDEMCEYIFADVTLQRLTSKVRVRAVSGETKGPISEVTSLPPRTPGPPYDLAASAPTGASFTVCWNRAFHRGSALVGFDIELFDSDAPAAAAQTVTGTWGTQDPDRRYRYCYTFHGITTAKTYYAKVRAQNGVGYSGWVQSPSVSLTATAPAAPELPSVAVTGTSAALTWAAPVDDGGLAVSDYDVRYAQQNADGAWSAWSSHSHTGTGTAATVTVQTGGVYQYQVAACNLTGTGGASACGAWSVSAVSGTVAPGAPTLSPASGGFDVLWAEPSPTGASPYTDYDLRYRKQNADNSWPQTWSPHAHTGAATEATLGGLDAGGDYQVQVRGTNGRGASAWSPSAQRTAGQPGLPTSVAASGSKGGVSVMWTAPAVTGGSSAVTAQVRTRLADADPATPGDQPGAWGSAVHPVVAADTSPARIIGLTPGAEVDVELRAANVNGPGDWAPAGSATPLATTSTTGARNVSAASVPGALVLVWDHPADDGGLALTWGIKVKSNPPDLSADWVSLSPAPATVTDPAGSDHARRMTSVTVGATTGLACGRQFQFTVRAVNAKGNGGWADSGTHTHACVPAKPTLSVAGGSTEATLTASVTSANHSSVTKWQYQGRTQTDGTWGSWGDWNDITAAGNSLSHKLTDLTNGTKYQFKVRAVNGVGASPASDAVTVTPAPDLPSTPTLTVTAGNAKVTLSASVTDNGGETLTRWEYKHKKKTGGTWPSTWSGISKTADSITHDVTQLANGTVYVFRVRAVNSAGASDASSDAEATPAAVPPAPTLTAAGGNASVALAASVTGNGGSAITRWEYNHKAAGEEYAATWTQVTGTALSISHSVTSGLANGTVYTFKMRAVNGAGNSTDSNEVQAKPNPLLSAPSLSAAAGFGEVTLSWAAVTNAAGYSVQFRKSAETAWTDAASGNSTCGSLAGSATGCDVTGLDDRVQYSFRARAVATATLASRNHNDSAWSTVATATPELAAPVLSPDDSVVSASWPPVFGASNHVLERSADGGTTWSAQNCTADSDGGSCSGLTNGTAYHFRYKMDLASGGSTTTFTSGSASATPNPRLDRPTLSVTAGAMLAVLSWAADSDASGWEVQLRTGTDPFAEPSASNDPDSPAAKCRSIAASATTCTVAGLTAGTVYRFRLRATGNSSYVSSLWSAEVSATALGAKLATPSPSVSIKSTATELGLSWTAVSGTGVSYAVQTRVSTSDDSNTWATPGSGTCTGSVTGTSCNLAGLTGGTDYDIRVRAANTANVDSDWSAAVTATAGTPGAPTGTVATATKGGVSVTWTAPAVTGGSTAFEAQVRTRVKDSDTATPGDQPGTWTAAVDPVLDPDESPVRIVGLTVGTEVDVELRVANAHAPGAWASAGSATPLATNAPTNARNVSVSSVSGALILVWDHPTDDGGLPLTWSFVVKTQNPPTNGFLYDFAGLSPTPAAVASDTHDHARRITGVTFSGWSGLACGRQFQFGIRATNADGGSGWPGTGTHTHACVPATPTLSVAAGDTQATLSASVTTNNHSSITKWQYQQRSETAGTWGSWSDWANITGTSNSLTYTVANLTNNTKYEFKVRAVNAIGNSPASTPAEATPTSP